MEDQLYTKWEKIPHILHEDFERKRSQQSSFHRLMDELMPP
jgi:hypothetical protein